MGKNLPVKSGGEAVPFMSLRTRLSDGKIKLQPMECTNFRFRIHRYEKARLIEDAYILLAYLSNTSPAERFLQQASCHKLMEHFILGSHVHHSMTGFFNNILVRAKAESAGLTRQVESEYLTISELCNMLGKSRFSIMRMKDEIPGRVKIGGSVRYRRASVVAWLTNSIEGELVPE